VFIWFICMYCAHLECFSVFVCCTQNHLATLQRTISNQPLRRCLTRPLVPNDSLLRHANSFFMHVRVWINRFLHNCVQGCQMVCFQTKNPNLGKFWRP
jgi:hypothetical protein